MKNNLIRQSSSPADLLAAIQDSMDESDPSMPIPAMMSPDDSLSGGTSEDNPTGNHSAKSMMYSRDDSFLATDTVVSGGLWNNPTSPGTELACFSHIPGFFLSFGRCNQSMCPTASRVIMDNGIGSSSCRIMSSFLSTPNQH